MKVTLLGTGTSQGVPVIGCKCAVCLSNNVKDKRLRSSIMIEVGTELFVIDTGPDFRQQMLREKVDHLTAVLFTHEHKDHVAGLDDIRAFNFVQKREMEVYASEQVQETILREFHYAFAKVKYPGVPQIHLKTIVNQPFAIRGVEFIPIEVMHHKLPVFGFRVGDFTYITDANFISDEEKEKIKGSKIIVINALRKESHISHFSLDEALGLVEELNPDMAYITHISHKMGLHKEVESTLPQNVRFAFDGLSFNL